MRENAQELLAARASAQIGEDGLEKNLKLNSPLSALAWALLLLSPLAYLWFCLLSNLSPEWTTNPQYGYGLIVPILCLGLLARRWQAIGERSQWSMVSGPLVSSPGGPSSDVSSQWSVVGSPSSAVGSQLSRLLVIFSLFAFLYLPTRLIEAAVPEWRPIQWSLAVVTLGLTLCFIYVASGRRSLAQSAFPIAFFLVAVPWPTLLENPIIQGLTRLNTGMVIEILNALGVPAVQHGNVIEVGTGYVGIDEACSGIRSFQSSVMISLFFGEFYRFRVLPRLLLVPIGFLVAMGFNLCRTFLLTFIAAKQGVAATSQYHDQAGFTILIASSFVMWLLVILLKSRAASASAPPANRGEARHEGKAKRPFAVWAREPVVRCLMFSLLAWLFIVEVGVQAWYLSREAGIVPGPAWSLEFPRDNPSFISHEIPANVRSLLRYDQGAQGQWSESDGTQWTAFYCDWSPGKVAGYLAKRHTPDVCMPASGCQLQSGPELLMVDVSGVNLPVRCYVFQTPTGPLNVFHCRWEAGAQSRAYVADEGARYNLVRAIWSGRGKNGQKVLEFSVSGCDSSEQAREALRRQLSKLVKVQQPAG